MASLQSTLLQAWWAFFVSMAFLSLGEVIVVLSRAQLEATFLLRYWPVCVAEASWVALFLSCPLLLLVALGRWVAPLVGRLPPIWRGPLVAACWGLIVAMVGILLLKPWDLAEDPYRISYALPGTGIVFGLVLYALRRGRFLPMALLVVSWSAFVLDAYAFRHLYPSMHRLAGYLAIQLGMLALWRIRRLWSTPRWMWLGVGVALVAHLPLMAGVRDLREVGLLHGTLQPALLGVLHRLADWDRDGYSALFGGGDCNDADPEVHPGRCEIPDNLVDDNCNGLTDSSPPSRPANPARVPRTPAPDVYLLVVDGLRADFGGPNARRTLAPELESFTSNSLAFRNAYTSYPSTFRAMIAMAQGRYWRYVDPAQPTFLAVLARASYDVGLWIHRARYKQSATGQALLQLDRAVGDPFGLISAGKDLWTASIVDEAIDELVRGSDSRPRFRWLHLLDTHQPTLRGAPDDPPLKRYKAEVRHVSRQLGRLIRALESSERGRRSVVILLADHGESFGEHGGRFHGGTLFDEVIKVPLIMRLPGVDPRIIEESATTLDVVPTLAAYLGLPEDPGWQGRNWLANPGEAGPPRVLSQVESIDNWGGVGLPARQMVREGRFKLVANVDDNVLELYDLQDDPAETHSRTNLHPETTHRLVRVVAKWQDLPGCRNPN